MQECKKNVIGALYNDFDGTIYSFDLKESGLTLNPCVYEFILKYKYELEKINYYSWARMLEQINNDDVLIRVINKLELSTPRRDNLSVYREILRKEFEENTCFYCGKKLQKSIHVDHFIPWSFVMNDELWNLMPMDASLNSSKSNRLPKWNPFFQNFAQNQYLMYQMIYDIANELIPLYLFSSASAPLLFPAAVTLPSFIYHPAAHQSNDDKDKNSDTHS